MKDMMKKPMLTAGILLASLMASPARTWTSSDGSKAFDGELQAYNRESGEVTLLIEGASVSFQQDKLSAVDLTFLNESVKQPPLEEAPPTAIKELLALDKTSLLTEGKFVESEIQGDPEYYILYFSASW